MRFKAPKARSLDYSGAEQIAAEAMAFLTSDQSRLTLFLALSGIEPHDLAASLKAGGTGALAACLDHIASDESLLLVFSSEIRRKPEEILTAQHILHGPTPLTGD